MRPDHARFPLMLLAALAALAVAAGPATAADTTEPFDRGATDFEMYLGQDGFGLETAEQSVGSEMVLGYGVTERVSAFVGAALSADGHFLNDRTEMVFGLYGTALDTRQLDLDLFLAFAGSGGGGFTASPSFELNWDAAPGLSRWGLYTRAGLAVTGHAGDAGPARTTDVEVALGTYWTVGAGRQLLLEFDGAFVDGAVGEPGGRRWDSGAFALGFNVGVTESMEMINQVHYHLADVDGHGSFGVMLGFIATLPAGS